MNNIQEITVHELENKINNKEDFLLIDVRENIHNRSVYNMN